VLVELLPPPQLLRAPFDEQAALQALGRLGNDALLSSARGLTPRAAAQLATAAVGLGDLALEQPRLASLDVNPIRVKGDRAAAVGARGSFPLPVLVGIVTTACGGGAPPARPSAPRCSRHAGYFYRSLAHRHGPHASDDPRVTTCLMRCGRRRGRDAPRPEFH